ncbi:MAG: right-handed parallel beta-helix repeat-containing protein, partial [Planctomycetota bacterium]|nr:right-handed parallel beta-helix repeat-containing protein [Planctomycetota bacterium]
NLIGSQWNNIHISAAQGITISGNSVYSGHHRNLLMEDCSQMVVGNNCFGHNADYGAEKELCTGVTLRNCRDSVFTGNVLQDCQSGRHLFPTAPELQREALLELYNCRNIIINSNQILDSAPYGIRLADCQDITLNATVVTDRRSPPLQKSAVYWTGKVGRSMITASTLGPSTEKTLLTEDQPLLASNLT